MHLYNMLYNYYNYKLHPMTRNSGTYKSCIWMLGPQDLVLLDGCHTGVTKNEILFHIIVKKWIVHEPLRLATSLSLTKLLLRKHKATTRVKGLSRYIIVSTP